MSVTFWIKRFLFVYLGVFLAVLGAGLLRERTLERALTDSAVWAGISASIFIATRIYSSRKGRHCALCGDTPEMSRPGASTAKKD